jgi:2-polyprenyl-3-methyl-5-hydroxy-6-metoxy-1,4-benzoquinol methylase
MKILCPICQDAQIEILEKLSLKDLERLYRNKLAIAIGQFVSPNPPSEIYFCICKSTDLRFFYPPVPGDEKLYTKLGEQEYYYSREKPEFLFANNYVEGQMKILEVGCGEGYWGESINCQEYVGLEMNPMAQSIAQQKGMTVLRQDLKEISVERFGQFDLVCGFQVLEHVANIRDFLESCCACLKPGGLLIFSVPSYDSFISLSPNNALNMPPHHLSWWSDKSLESLASIFGLELIDLHHDKLSMQHRHWYAYTLILNAFLKLVGIKPSLLQQSLPFLVISKFSNWLAFLFECFLSDQRLLPDGHSVTAVYRKPVP